MNYINQINIFFRIAGSAELSSSARILYLSLMNKNNILTWIKQFTCTASELEGFSGLSQSSLQRARKQLIDKGLIAYKKMGANRPPKYSIYELTNERVLTILNSTPVNTPNSSPNSTPVNTANTLVKLNETEPNHLYTDMDTREDFSLNIWPEFPKQQKFEEAFRSYGLALAAGAKREQIIDGIKKYTKYLKVKKKGDGYTAMPSNWLDGRRWLDKYDMSPENPNPSGSSDKPKRVESLPDWARDDYKPKNDGSQMVSAAEMAELDRQLADMEARNKAKEKG